MSRRRCPPSVHRQSILPSTRFKRLPVWVTKADIVAYLKLSPTDAHAFFVSAYCRCLIDSIEKNLPILTQPCPDLRVIPDRAISRFNAFTLPNQQPGPRINVAQQLMQTKEQNGAFTHDAPNGEARSPDMQ